MSIIHDALKKVQQSLDGQKKTSSTAASGSPSFCGEKFPGISQALILLSFVVSLLILTLFILFPPKETKNMPAPLPERKETLAGPALTPPASVMPNPPPARPSRTNTDSRLAGLALTGIVKTGDEYIALINNKIVREGDALGEKKVLAITSDHVKIFDRGEAIFLRLNGL